MEDLKIDWLSKVIGSQIQAITADPGCLCLVLTDDQSQAHLLMLSVEDPEKLGIRVLSLNQAIPSTQQTKPSKKRRWSLLPDVG